MTGRALLLSDRVRRIVQDAPAPPATWSSVLRRTAVVVGFFIAGLATGHLPLTVLAAFGALQVGLVEAAIPFRKLVLLLATLIVCMAGAVFVAMIIPLIAALAYAFGATAALGARVATVGVSSLALAVIFGGMHQSPHQALINTAWVTFGALVQAVAWLILWRSERTAYVRRALAAKVRADMSLLSTRVTESVAVVRALNATEAVREALDQAGLDPNEESSLRQVLSESIRVMRATTAWKLVRVPGDAQRLRVAVALAYESRRLDDRPGPRRRLSVDAAPSSDEQVSHALAEALAGLDRSIDRALSRRPVEESIDNTLLPSAMRAADPAPLRLGDITRALRLGSADSRHGVRMAIGVGLAQALTFVLPHAHSFWLPLTVVFTLKPDWSFTVIRGMNRTLGNLGAVIVLPALFLAFNGAQWPLAVALAILCCVTFRWFFGNYSLASFGLAGTVLVLDFALDPSDDLFVARIIAAALGAVLALGVSLALPAWRSSEAPEQVDLLTAALDELQRGVTDRLRGDDSVTEGVLETRIAHSRQALSNLEPTAGGALLEPHPVGDPVALALIASTGTRLLSDLVGLAFISADAADVDGPDARAVALELNRLNQTHRELADVAAAFRHSVPR